MYFYNSDDVIRSVEKCYSKCYDYNTSVANFCLIVSVALLLGFHTLFMFVVTQAYMYIKTKMNAHVHMYMYMYEQHSTCTCT